MKKSEFEAARKQVWGELSSETRSWSAFVRDDVLAAEAAGVIWDPEEESLAAWLECGWRGGEVCLYAEGDVRRPASHRELAEAGRHYNRRKDIALVAEQLRRRGAAPPPAGRIVLTDDLLRWADLLEGKQA